MATLIIPQIYTCQIQSLASRKPLHALSVKRITTLVRAHLRAHKIAAVVSCHATWVNGAWRGTCVIGTLSRTYRVT